MFPLSNYRAAHVPALGAAVAIVTIAVCLYFAEKLHQTKPWPYTTITSTAIHPPSSFFIRMGLIPSCVLIGRTWCLAGAWLRDETARSNRRFPGQLLAVASVDKIQNFGVVASLLLIISTGLIEVTKMPFNIHAINATGFFVLTFVAQVMTTIRLYKLSVLQEGLEAGKQTVMKWSLWLKAAINVFSVGLLVSDIISLIFRHSVPKWLGPLTEWLATAAVLLYIGTFFFDFDKVGLSVRTVSTASLEEEEEERMIRRKQKALC